MDTSSSHPGSFTTCSVCLGVMRGEEWIAAEEAIREARTFDRSTPPRLLPGLCDDCFDAIAARRYGARAARAA
jgi:hypothetical protein